LVRYNAAVARFFAWIDTQGVTWGSNPGEFDSTVASYIEHLWSSGESKAWANDACSGLQHHVPNLRGKLFGSWRLLRAWSKIELPNRATPISLKVLLAFIGLALEKNDLNEALCYALCFQGLLRPAEAFQLVPQAIDLNHRACSAIITLRYSKGTTRSGNLEQITTDDPMVICLLSKWLINNTSQTPLIINTSGFRRNFNKRNNSLGFPAGTYKPYSMRRGGATLLFKLTQSFDHVAQRGRWRHVRTARIYINEAQAELAKFAMTPAQIELVHRYAACCTQYFKTV